jgi:hypothetical protein
MAWPAKYRGRCPTCHHDILPGDMVRFDFNESVVHAGCEDAVQLDLNPGKVCDKCRMELPKSGICGSC